MHFPLELLFLISQRTSPFFCYPWELYGSSGPPSLTASLLLLFTFLVPCKSFISVNFRGYPQFAKFKNRANHMPHKSVVFASAYQFTTSLNLKTTNTSWKLGKYCTWRVIECSSGIITACLPALRHFSITISSKLADQRGPQKIKTANRQISEVTQPSNLTFRPKNELLTKPRVHLTVTQIEDESGDEVPLNTIMVRHSMTWQETIGARSP